MTPAKYLQSLDHNFKENCSSLRGTRNFFVLLEEHYSLFDSNARDWRAFFQDLPSFPRPKVTHHLSVPQVWSDNSCRINIHLLCPGLVDYYTPHVHTLSSRTGLPIVGVEIFDRSFRTVVMEVTYGFSVTTHLIDRLYSPLGGPFKSKFEFSVESNESNSALLEFVSQVLSYEAAIYISHHDLWKNSRQRKERSWLPASFTSHLIYEDWCSELYNEVAQKLVGFEVNCLKLINPHLSSEHKSQRRAAFEEYHSKFLSQAGRMCSATESPYAPGIF